MYETTSKSSSKNKEIKNVLILYSGASVEKGNFLIRARKCYRIRETYLLVSGPPFVVLYKTV